MQIWHKVIQKLQEDRKVILLLVVSHKGSSPGKQGFKMMVCDDGFLFGSIGGGRTEFQLVEKARELFNSESFDPFLINQVHREDENDSSGMVCAGEQLVLFYYLGKEHIDVLKNIVEKKKGVLSIDSSGFNYDENSLLESNFFFNEQKWEYKENVDRRSRIYLIGGGHVSLAVSQLFSFLDFEVIVFENRENINTFEENIFADKKLVIDFNNIERYIPEGNNSFIAILTHGHDVDKLVLSKLFKKKYKYIGLLGSKSKVNQMFNAFVQEGIDRNELFKVDAPIGLEIGSKTPTEIAVSIAAKIIMLENKPHRIIN